MNEIIPQSEFLKRTAAEIGLAKHGIRRIVRVPTLVPAKARKQNPPLQHRLKIAVAIILAASARRQKLGDLFKFLLHGLATLEFVNVQAQSLGDYFAAVAASATGTLERDGFAAAEFSRQSCGARR